MAMFMTSISSGLFSSTQFCKPSKMWQGLVADEDRVRINIFSALKLCLYVDLANGM